MLGPLYTKLLELGANPSVTEKAIKLKTSDFLAVREFLSLHSCNVKHEGGTTWIFSP